MKHSSGKQEEKQQDGKGCAVLVKARDVTDLDGFCAYDLVGYGVGPYGFTVAPAGVPLLKINGINTDRVRQRITFHVSFVFCPRSKRRAAPILHAYAVVEPGAVAEKEISDLRAAGLCSISHRGASR